MHALLLFLPFRINCMEIVRQYKDFRKIKGVFLSERSTIVNASWNNKSVITGKYTTQSEPCTSNITQKTQSFKNCKRVRILSSRKQNFPCKQGL